MRVVSLAVVQMAGKLIVCQRLNPARVLLCDPLEAGFAFAEAADERDGRVLS